MAGGLGGDEGGFPPGPQGAPGGVLPVANGRANDEKPARSHAPTLLSRDEKNKRPVFRLNVLRNRTNYFQWNTLNTLVKSSVQRPTPGFFCSGDHLLSWAR